MKYIGYVPVPGCCESPKEKIISSLYLCEIHGWKSINHKPEGYQLKIEL